MACSDGSDYIGAGSKIGCGGVRGLELNSVIGLFAPPLNLIILFFAHPKNQPKVGQHWIY